jgi:hypothetical protein
MITLPSLDPSDLLDRIKGAIDAKRIKTWAYDQDGDFTHTAEQWNQMAWLRPSVRDQELRLNIIPPADTHISSQVYAVYHGRFIEMILRHFDILLAGNAAASPLPSDKDRIS